MRFIPPGFLANALRFVVAAACFAALAPAHADAPYPARTIRIVVPWSPGVPADAACRILAERMSASMKQPVIVDNRPGASGTIGYEDVLRQPADGYTIYILSSASLVTPLLFPTRHLNFLKELEPVGHVHWSYNALVVPATSKLQTLADIIAAGKSSPGKLTYASAGTGTPAQMAGAAFSRHADFQATHVPYVQFANAMTDVMSGRVDFMFMTTVSAVPMVAAGKMRALAVTSAKRLPAMPNVPTMGELGVPDFVFRSFETMTVKAGTPKEIVERLNAELSKALAVPSVREQFTANGWDIEPMSTQQIGAVLRSESNRWTKLGVELHVQAN